MLSAPSLVYHCASRVSEASVVVNNIFCGCFGLRPRALGGCGPPLPDHVRDDVCQTGSDIIHSSAMIHHYNAWSSVTKRPVNLSFHAIHLDFFGDYFYHLKFSPFIHRVGFSILALPVRLSTETADIHTCTWAGGQGIRSIGLFRNNLMYLVVFRYDMHTTDIQQKDLLLLPSSHGRVHPAVKTSVVPADLIPRRDERYICHPKTPEIHRGKCRTKHSGAKLFLSIYAIISLIEFTGGRVRWTLGYSHMGILP